MGADEGRVENPTEFSDDAFKEPEGGGLSEAQFALRLEAKREQAMQDAGWIVPPGQGADVEPIEEKPERARDEQGRFVAAEGEQPEAADEEAATAAADAAEEELPDDATDAEREAARQEAVEEFYAGRYRTREEAERGIEEKDATIQRLFNEINDLKKREEEPDANEPAELDVPAWHAWAEEAVAAGHGAQGAVEALKRGGPEGYDIYLAHWQADPDQAVDANVFNNKVQRMLAEQAALRAVRPVLEPKQREDAKAEAESARAAVAARYSDFEQLQPEMDRLVQEEGALPETTVKWLSELAQSGPEGKQHAWEYLYLQATRSAAPRREKAARTARDRQRTSVDAAKIAATVSSAEGTPSRTSLTATEREVIRRKNEIRKEAGLELLTED